MKLKKIFNDYVEFQNSEIKEAMELINKCNKFESSEIKVDTDLSRFKFKHVLYYFEIPTNITAKEICEVIDTEKKKKKKKNDVFKLPKVNFKNAEISNNKILYVGKSSGFFSTRLKQHIGNESPKTYALHLKEWERMFGREIIVNLHYVTFQNQIDENNKHLLELIETSLHYKLKPILGRTGH